MTTRLLLLGLLLLVLVTALFLRKLRAGPPPTSDRLELVRRRVAGPLAGEFKRRHLKLGDPVFLRIFKEERELELWVRDPMGGRYQLFRKWPVASYGGGRLGPKLREGDGIAPEGFYHVGKRQLNPRSKYHLAINLGYPNAFDRHHGRTGSYLMIHGGEESIGCYAMTDPVIEIIYLAVEAALSGKLQDEVSVHCLPFRMTAERLERERGSEWYGFWANLKEGSDLFEQTKVPPLVAQKDGRYVFRRRDP